MEEKMTPQEAMEKLADKTLPIAEVADILEQFDSNNEVENSVVMNLSLRTSVYDRNKEKSDVMEALLQKLAYSKEMSVRWAVAKNPHTPIAILKELAKDSVNLVRALVATNPNTPSSVLQSFFSDEKIVRDGLSGNPSTPQKYLTILADDSDDMVRLRVVENPSTTEEILKKLTNDAANNVRQAVQVRLKRMKG